MKINRFFCNSLGLSLPLVIAIISAGVASLGYVTVQMLPKLQSEKKRSEQTINYRIFVSSLNDYIVNAIKEKWCISVNDNDETDLLLSNSCSSSQPMESIVTYKGNLERILWSPDIIGAVLNSAPAVGAANTILALNYIRLHSSPQKTKTKLSFSDINPLNDKLSFKLSEKTLQDMTDEHPLYTMAQSVKSCISSVDIDVFKTKEFSNAPAGDERKIGIKIKINTKKSSLSCLTIQNIQSTTFYTFYPRRLHYYSLLKYGDLDTNHQSEFHGPVYIGGNIKLPNDDMEKNKSAVFYAPVTLGIYNSGGGEGSPYYAGIIKNSNNNDYSFNDFGDPIKSKQDFYSNFRGFLGGLSLDATEDKGFHNLFNFSSSTSMNTSQLEACIEDSKSQTTPSYNNESIFAYDLHQKNDGSMSLRFSFTKKNRFNLQKDAPRILRKDKNINFINPDINGNVNGVEEFSKVTFMTQDGSHIVSLGHGVDARFIIDQKSLDFHPDDLQKFIDNVKNSKKNTFLNVIPNNHVLRNTNEYKEYIKSAERLKDKCDDKASLGCSLELGYQVDLTCAVPLTCLYSELNQYISEKNSLISFLSDIKSKISSIPYISVSMDDVKQNNKLVLNQKDFSLNINQSFKTTYLYNKNKLSSPYELILTPFHYGNQDFKLIISLKPEDLSDYTLSSQEDGQEKNFLQNEWRNTFNNRTFNPAPSPMFTLDCPAGMGVADWDLDMSSSANFAWNYANTPPGVEVDNSDHSMIPEIIFDNTLNEGHQASYTKSIIQNCIIPTEREEIYGFYTCETLEIKPSRKKPLYMIGTFIVKNLIIPKDLDQPIYWHSIWDPKASDLILNNFNKTRNACSNASSYVTKTLKDYVETPMLLNKLKSCGSLDLVTNGPNNFNWTTVDPDVGLASPTDVMTSQKTKRIQKWIVKEETRIEVIR